MSLEVKKLTSGKWAEICSDAHLVGFNHARDPKLDRIDYALLVVDELQNICGWLTAREFDSETVYWQYGAGTPESRNGPKVVETYSVLVEDAFKKYKRICTLVENENVKYLKLAMHFGFRIIGTRLFESKVYVELMNERKQ